MNYNSKRIPGCDYSTPARDLIIRLIDTDAMCVKELAELTGRRIDTINTILRKMKADKLIYVAKWKKSNSGPASACFRLGDKEDAPRPAPKPATVRLREYRKSAKGRETRNEYKMRKNNMAKAKRSREKAMSVGIVAIDPLLSALMGVSCR